MDAHIVSKCPTIGQIDSAMRKIDAVLALVTMDHSGEALVMKTSSATLLAFAFSCLFAFAEKPILMTPANASKWLSETASVQVLDVRTKEEFESSHLINAVLIPWTDEDFEKRATAELKKDQPLFVYCRSGGRSSKAVEALEKLGFTNIHELKGGMLAWEKAKQPTTPAEK